MSQVRAFGVFRAVCLGVFCGAGGVSSAQVLFEDHKFVADSGDTGGHMGSAVAIEGDTLVVGAFVEDIDGVESGAAYVFDAVSGDLRFRLAPVDGDDRDHFGRSAAIDGGVIAVGAPHDDDAAEDAGAVYLFDATTGEQLRKIVPSDGERRDYFGVSFALRDGRLVVGVERDEDMGRRSGSVYVYDAVSGEQLSKLYADDIAVGDGFGASVALRGGMLLVSSFRDDDNGEDSGSVYLFDLESGVQVRKFLPEDGGAGELFGTTVDLNDSLVVVGAGFADVVDRESGAAYVFDLHTGSQIRKLVPSDASRGDTFGMAVTIGESVIVLSATSDAGDSSGVGAAYLFDTASTQQVAKILASDGDWNDRFGSPLAIQADRVFIAAYADNEAGYRYGAAYGFTIGCYADVDRNGLIEEADFLWYLDRWTRGASVSDWDINGVVDVRDLLRYLRDWAGGC